MQSPESVQVKLSATEINVQFTILLLRLWQFARHRFIHDYHAIDLDMYPIFTALYGYFQPEEKKNAFSRLRNFILRLSGR